MTGASVLVVEDDPAVRTAVRGFLARKGFRADAVTRLEQALERLKQDPPQIIVADYELPDGNALRLLPVAQEASPPIPVVILTGHGSVELAVRAIQAGADQFLTKPVDLPVLVSIVERALKRRRLNGQKILEDSRRSSSKLDPFRGESPLIRRLESEAKRLLRSESPILILGESGSGKGVLARWLHENSVRSEEAFVDLNCAGLSREFLESELFGHEKGAFTGADRAKSGLLEVADRGTVFLDEIGDVDPLVQPKLLKVLEEKRFRRLGQVGERTVDVRLLAATHRNLEELVSEGSFRADLFYRISALPLTVPALRDRAEDLGMIAADILKGLSRDLGRETSLSASAEERLRAYSWPGNLRELRNVLERALLLSDREHLQADDFSFLDRSGAAAAATSSLLLSDVEKQHIERVLEHEGGKMTRTAERLGIAKSTLYEKIRRHKIDRSH